MEFHPLSTTMKYQQKYSNSFCFSSLASVLTVSGEVVVAMYIA